MITPQIYQEMMQAMESLAKHIKALAPKDQPKTFENIPPDSLVEIPEGFTLWRDESPKCGVVEVWRFGQPVIHTIELKEVHPAMNVHGLYWRKVS